MKTGNTRTKGSLTGPVIRGTPTKDSHDETLLVGSIQWQSREDQKATAAGQHYNPLASIRRAYARLPEISTENLSGAGETETGMTIHHDFINRVEMEQAAYYLPDFQRICWLLSAIDGRDYQWIAERFDSTEQSVRKAVSRAGKAIMERILDRL